MVTKETKFDDLPLFAETAKGGAGGATADRTRAGSTPKKWVDPAQAGREDKRRAMHAKRLVYPMERENKGEYIIACRSTKNWWIVGDLSAMIYRKLIAPRLDRKTLPKLLIDGDYENKFLHGTCAIKNINTFTKELETLGIKEEQRSEYYVVFRYRKEPLSKAERESMLNEMQNDQDRINETVMHNNICPSAYHSMIQIQEKMLDSIRKVPRLEKDIYGREMLEEMRKIVMTYIKLTNNFEKIEDAWALMLSSIEIILYNLQELTELNLIEKKRGFKMLGQILDLKKMLNGELRKCSEKLKQKPIQKD